jgi:hypothetical protein
MYNDDDEAPWHRYGWIESPDGYYEDREIDWSIADLTVWRLTVDQAMEVAALFGNRRIDWRTDGVLTVYGVPPETHKWFDDWFTDWGKKRGIIPIGGR